ncbi:non-hydrolyzing UDP-N-acetylglucosamine 2-epimerase [Capillibacterium thermochitinicola]|uniref:UDP-N-acetylglucosamine 2-epimerase (non-hydrolyzing) n=1 Tax=Capillibacterium thermochitinicola TaxID=2699427 RepID=A0A8J6HYZ3_9FIRM|nr:UDP-N-acetylglucosamine 2-epimerase (non-hydrolyzing) [Capillibacterium thermochitinicola]MBA2131948.1 UDP-N-acetylglucosamine 2-epimerase (non-hydrolyzing) [Capillibacterium thermochitinicola]
MEKIKVLSIFGTRPEAIKMAPLVKEMEKEDKIESYVCITAQHREMLDQVLEIFEIKPDYDLNIMEQRQDLVTIITKALEGLYQVINGLKPDLVLVHGDTSTTFAGALAAFYNKIPVGHVEAGLRTYDKYSPYPEEINRVLTGKIAEIHFAPTLRNKENLIKENVKEGIYVTGNTVIDALKYTVDTNYVFKDPQLKEIDFGNGKHILLTAHRRENLGERLGNICRAVKRLVENFEDLVVIYPVHLNPAVRETVNSILGGIKRVLLIDPIDVQDMHNLMYKSYLVMTDSGGLQEEAPSLGKPVLVLRTETERPEAVEAGTVKLAGVNEDDIYNMAYQLLTDKNTYETMAQAVNPYGDGNASRRIVQAILHKFGFGARPEDFRVETHQKMGIIKKGK